MRRVTVDSVLIVDDSAAQRSVGAALCRELGIARVYEAGNGQEALAMLDSLVSQPSLLIVDLEMPTMDGLKLLEHLRGRSGVPPIIIASSRERALVNAAQGLGSALGLCILSTIQKPLTLEKLTEALHGMAERGAPGYAPDAAPVDPKALQAGIDAGQIIVYYQPQVELATGHVRRVEALARWKHDALGLISPARFIPVAEQHGLIHQLTLQVLNQALLQASLWKAGGIDVAVAVNLSPALLYRAELVEEVADVQQCHGISPDHLTLEITETSLMRDLAVALGVRWTSATLTAPGRVAFVPGVQENALPSSADATVQCRVFPGETEPEILATLQKVAADPGIKVTLLEPVQPAPETVPDPKVMAAISGVVHSMWPGVTVVPEMGAGASDSIFTRAAGIPSYGVGGGWNDLNDLRMHGRDERKESATSTQPLNSPTGS